MVTQNDACTKSGIESQEITTSPLPPSNNLCADDCARIDTSTYFPASSDKKLDAVTPTSSTHSCLTSLPSILVTLSTHGDGTGEVVNKDDEDSPKTSTEDVLLCTSHVIARSQSSLSSQRTLTNTHPSMTLLNQTSVDPSRRLFKGSSLRISRTYSDSTGDCVNNPPLSGCLRVPSLDTRSHSAPLPPPSSTTSRKLFSTQTSPTAMSWLTDKSYGITPPFTRLSIQASGVVLPLTVREYQRQQHLKEFEKMRKEDVMGGARKLSSAVPCSLDRLHGTVQPTSRGIGAQSADTNASGPLDSSSFPRIFGNGTEINQRVVAEEVLHVPAAQSLLQHGCTCEAGHPCLCRRTIDRRISKISRKDSEEGPGTDSKGVGNRRTATISVLIKIASKFNRGTSSSTR